MTLRARLVASTLALLFAGAAQTFPDRPVTVIVPFTAGGGSDLIARALQPELAKSLGQPVVVVNRDLGAHLRASSARLAEVIEAADIRISD